MYCIVLYTPVLQDESCKTTVGFLTSTGGDSPCTWPPINVPIQRTVNLFSVIPANATKESMVGHQNVSSPAAGIKPDNLAPEASMCANH